MTKIDIDFKETLTRAYMKLFDALTEVYMANNCSHGQSLYYATGVMRKIIYELPHTPASKYLTALFNTHKATVAKKSMLVPDSARKPYNLSVVENNLQKVDAALGTLLYMTENIDMQMLVQKFEMPKLPPLPEIVIQNDIRKNKPIYHPQVKQMITAPAAFIKNYNLRNARRRTR